MLHPYLFHGFQPIGGVLPNPLSNPYTVTRMTQINKCLYINFNILIGKKNDSKLSILQNNSEIFFITTQSH
jgi:hypothetical protein